ncbi:Heat repeat domain containing protein, partial [Globisporangium splendens]
MSTRSLAFGLNLWGSDIVCFPHWANKISPSRRLSAQRNSATSAVSVREGHFIRAVAHLMAADILWRGYSADVHPDPNRGLFHLRTSRQRQDPTSACRPFPAMRILDGRDHGEVNSSTIFEKKNGNMDLDAVWQQILRFQENYIATSGSIAPSPQEQELVRDFLQHVPIAALFACLQDASDHSDDKQINPFLLAGLSHFEKRARVLTVNQLTVHLGRNPTLEQVSVVANPLAIDELCNVIADEDAEVASKASNVLELFARFPEGEFFRSVLDSLKTKAQSRYCDDLLFDSDIEENSVEYMRYLEVIARICQQSDARMEHAIGNGAVHLSDDPLFLMNVVDLIPNLCNTRLGIQYIFQSGALQSLLNMSEDPFVGGSAIRLIGEVSAIAAKLNVQSWNWSDPVLSKAFLETIENKIQDSDSLQQIAAMDALAAFGSSSDKARILGAPTRLTQESEDTPAENAGIWALHERLFNSLGLECRNQSTLLYLMEVLRQPFEELRSAIFALLRAVAAQNNEWGMRALLSYGGFFEFLMDRSTEPTKEAREWKFAVADAVMASPFQSKLDAVTLEKLRAHMRKGPYVGVAPPSMDLEAA